MTSVSRLPHGSTPTAGDQVTAGPSERPDRLTVVAAAELLAHWWSRPTADEVAAWRAASAVEAEVRRTLSGGTSARPVSFGATVATDELLEEYERLFVGPGPVSCPPYESFWREDVPIDIRRSLMGPCTAELRRLYAVLGLVSSPNELADHVAVQFEALAYALASDAAEVARALFAEHLRPFLPRLCRAVDIEASEPFYRALAQLTMDWLIPIADFCELAGAPDASG